MRKHTKPTREQWLKKRHKYLTSSDAPVIAGVGYTDRFTLWARKTGKIPDQGDQLRFRVGLALEELIHQELEQEAGVTLHDPGSYVLMTREWRGATPDRMIVKSPQALDDFTGIAEFKTVSAANKRDWKEGPSLYASVQMLHTMEVTGLDWGLAAALLGLDDFTHHEVTRDEQLLEMLLEAEHAFWEHVQQDIPPPLGYEESNKTLKVMFPEAVEKKTVEIETAKARAALKGWRTAKQAIKELKRELREIEKQNTLFENELRLALKDAERGEIGDAGTVTLKTTKREGYTVEPTSYRTLREERRKKV
jgi:predicted phage-related endonuclease